MISHFVLLVFTLISLSLGDLTGDEFCSEHFVENRYYYNDAEDCHFYFQCDDAGHGWKRECANGTFWSGVLMQCVPESHLPCRDHCVDMPSNHCYGIEGQCSTFYRCANTISYKFCCPENTYFNETKCACEHVTEDNECTDICETVQKPTTTREPPTVGEDSCIDSWGNTLRPVNDNAAKFINGEVEFDCALGTWFNLATCDCSIEASGDTDDLNERQSLLYFPFDHDFNDYSHNKFETTVFEPVTINKTFGANGEGAAYFTSDGWIEIPGTKNFDFGKFASWCFFFNTTNADGSFLTLEESNGYKLRFQPSGETGFQATIAFEVVRGMQPWTDVTLNGKYTINDEYFQHVCVIADGTFVKLFLNNEMVDKKQFDFSGERIAVSYAPYRVGSGLLFGIIDELLICPFEMTTPEIQAHFAGDTAFLQAQGLIPPSVARVQQN